MLAAALLTIVGCQEGDSEIPSLTEDRLRVATTTYPVEYFVQRIGGDRVIGLSLIPNDIDPHTFEPTASTLRRLTSVDIVITTGESLDHWLRDAIQKVDGVNRVAIHELYEPESLRSRGGHANTTTSDDAGIAEPHAWLDPILADELVVDIEAILAASNFADSQLYARNSEVLRGELMDLHRRYAAGLAACHESSFVASHAAYGYLADRYGLRQFPLFGTTPETPPTPARLAELVSDARERELQYLLVEPLGTPRAAETFARELGMQILTINALSNIDSEARQAGADYFSLMESNLQSLRIALQCT